MSEDDIRAKAARGFRWMLLSKLLVQVISWGSTIAVLRLLAPEDYGVNAMATVVIGIGLLIAEFGLTTAIVQAPSIDDKSLRTAYGFALLVNGVAFLATLCLTPVASAFFRNEDLYYVIPVATLQFPLLSFYSIPSALLERELRFREKAVSDMAAGVVGAIATLLLAYQGAGYWALVVGALLTTLARVLWLNLIVAWPKWPIFKGIRQSPVLRFAGAVTIGRVLWFVYSRADTFVVGRLLGDAALGTYSVGTEIAATPLTKIAPSLSQVMTAAVSRLGSDLQAAQRMAKDVLATISVLSFPIFYGLAAVAPDLMVLLAGEKWQDAGTLIFLLCLIGPLKAAGVVCMSTITASGMARLQIRQAMLACVIFPTAFTIGALSGGLPGVAYAWIVAYPFYLFLTMRLTAILLKMKLLSLFKPSLIPGLCAVMMVIGTSLIAELVPEQRLPRLGLQIAGGALIYLSLLRLLSKDDFSLFFRTLSGRKAGVS